MLELRAENGEVALALDGVQGCASNSSLRAPSAGTCLVRWTELRGRAATDQPGVVGPEVQRRAEGSATSYATASFARHARCA